MSGDRKPVVHFEAGKFHGVRFTACSLVEELAKTDMRITKKRGQVTCLNCTKSLAYRMGD